MTQTDYAMLRVPRPYRQQAGQLRERIVQAKLNDTLPPELKALFDPSTCAACGSGDVERVSIHLVACNSCHAQKHIVETEGSLDTFLKGLGVAALFGFGIYALNKLLEPKKGTARPAAKKKTVRKGATSRRRR